MGAGFFNAKKIPAIWIKVGAIVAPATLAAFKFAQAGLNADIILNQIMALYNPTLFYWGQNRLFNLVPFLLQFVTWPLLNLYFVLLGATLSFFSLVWILSSLAPVFLKNDYSLRIAATIYIFNVLACILLFKAAGWIEICLWHFEYSLALALGITAARYYYKKSISSIALACLLAILALGLNPSLVILLFCFVFFKCLCQGTITRWEVIIAISGSIIFAVWVWISLQYGSYGDYSHLIPGMFLTGMENFIINFFRLYARFGILALLCAASMASGLLLYYFHIGDMSLKISRLVYLSVAICLTMIIMASIIACIQWYHMNEFGPRYFIFLIYLAIFLFSLWVCFFLTNINFSHKFYSPITILIFFGEMLFFWPGSFNLARADIYSECSAITPGDHLYAGDYWHAWACVSRDMNSGFKSHAFAYRSISDRNNLYKTISRLENASSLEVLCLHADVKDCEKQINNYLQNYEVLEFKDTEAALKRLILKLGRQSEWAKKHDFGQ